MRITLTRAIATEYLGSIPRGSVLDVSVDVGQHLVERGFAEAEQGDTIEGVANGGIIREFDEDRADAGREWPSVAEDSGSGADGEDGASS